MSDFHSFEELSDFFDDVMDTATDIAEPHKINIEEILTPSFVSEHSSYSCFDELLSAGGYTYEMLNEDIPESFNEFICQHTHFKDWDSMLQEAANAFVTDSLEI